MAFHVAGSMAVKDGMHKARPYLLEPIMKVDVVMPEEYLGDVMGDLASRRGHILGMEGRGTSQNVKASVPLAEMFGYATELRSMTSGRRRIRLNLAITQRWQATLPTVWGA